MTVIKISWADFDPRRTLVTRVDSLWRNGGRHSQRRPGWNLTGTPRHVNHDTDGPTAAAGRPFSGRSWLAKARPAVMFRLTRFTGNSSLDDVTDHIAAKGVEDDVTLVVAKMV